LAPRSKVEEHGRYAALAMTCEILIGQIGSEILREGMRREVLLAGISLSSPSLSRGERSVDRANLGVDRPSLV
jgi:hypothetical protein